MTSVQIREILEVVYDDECLKRDAATRKGLIHAEGVHRYVVELLVSIISSLVIEEREQENAMES